MPKTEVKFNSEAAMQHASRTIQSWAAQDGEITRAEAGAELTQIIKDLIGKQEHGAISYKALAYLMYEELLTSES